MTTPQQISKFEYEQVEGLGDRCFVKIDDRYELAIIRTDAGLIIDVWPINNGEYWDFPYDSLQVFDGDTTLDEETAGVVGGAA
jgi:hypothetical protein